MKKTYYISISSGEILTTATDSPWDFKIKADNDEITLLREYFDQLYREDWKGFFRSHAPYIQYHYDRENDHIDDLHKKIYKMLYELGDEEAKNHISSERLVSEIDRQT
ncbi:hydrolase [Bacillus carboniphilus]|uniref:Hydrolase n=1 Tax=Bacillus carboniphilus TaxID=86663 RepID=A0ABY9JP46_9BACI|nr:hydrolase [Bacillus carboniphilus]WLR41182.1 hydrolase [Bacillus carboniphilus]